MGLFVFLVWCWLSCKRTRESRSPCLALTHPVPGRVSPGGIAGRGTSVVPIEFHAGTHVSTTLGAPFDSHTKTQNYRGKKRKKKNINLKSNIMEIKTPYLMEIKIGNISVHGIWTTVWIRDWKLLAWSRCPSLRHGDLCLFQRCLECPGNPWYNSVVYPMKTYIECW